MIKLSSDSPKIVVVGSSSIDIVLNTDSIPTANETIIASASDSYFGGKGSNQAVGTSRLGAHVHFVGCVGMDPMGQQIMRHLKDEGVNVGFLYESYDAPTGSAYVIASKNENAVIVNPAANSKITVKQLHQAEKYIKSANMVLVQLEIPLHIIEETIKIAKNYQVPVGIYASPIKKLSNDIIDYASFVVVKKSDLDYLFGDSPQEKLLIDYPNKLLVRDEGNSTSYYNGEEMRYYRQENIGNHTLGIGDAFTSGFAIARCNGNSVEESVKFGNTVAQRVTMKKGAQQGLPYLEDLT